MRYLETAQQSYTLGRKAMSLMERNRSPATPPNYEVWYNYVSGRNQEIVERIDKAIESDGVLSQWHADQIHTELLGGDELGREVERLGAQMSGELSEIMSILERAAGKTSEYETSLGTVTAELDTATDSTSIKAIVETLLKTTHDMREHNSLLEHRLHDSCKQIDDLNHHLDSVRLESRTDELTGIANRKHFNEQLEYLAGEAAEGGHELCLLMGDVDHFKVFNDNYGHQTGDQVLRFVAHAIRTTVRASDVAARYGGEEFAMLLPESDLQGAVMVAEQIRKAIRSKELVKRSTGEKLGRITMSFGVALYRPGEPLDSFVHRADMCLYAAKKAGRNRVRSQLDEDVGLAAEVA